MMEKVPVRQYQPIPDMLGAWQAGIADGVITSLRRLKKTEQPNADVGTDILVFRMVTMPSSSWFDPEGNASLRMPRRLEHVKVGHAGGKLVALAGMHVDGRALRSFHAQPGRLHIEVLILQLVIFVHVDRRTGGGFQSGSSADVVYMSVRDDDRSRSHQYLHCCVK